MSMVKFSGIDVLGRLGEPVSLVKWGRAGLGPCDRRALIKRAGAWAPEALKNLRFRPGEEPVHVVALGTTEAYGPNRNGDGFRVPTCRRDHPTFVKHARFYRNHKHHDPEISYGRVAASFFNEPLSRIELIVGLNRTKEAARANRGLIADRELDLLFAHKDVPVSMATAVPYDICSGCGNRAKTRAQYCDEQTCVKYGGLKKHLGRTFDDGVTLHADNDVNRWMDISYVERGADRTAYVLGRCGDDSEKIAEDRMKDTLFRRITSVLR